MPHALIDVVRARSVPKLRSVAADDVVPRLLFKVRNCPGEEACGDEVEKASRYDEENLQLRGRSTPIRGVSDLTEGFVGAGQDLLV